MKDYTLYIEELEDKSKLSTKTTLLLAFEYLTAKICNGYSKSRKIDSVAEFNKTNKISYYKAIVFPFFVATSNGNSKSLYTLFGDFYILGFGPASMAIHEALRQGNNLKYFNQVSTTNPFGIEVKDINKNFDTIQKEILQSKISFNEENVLFSELLVINDNNGKTLLSEAIDNGIEIIAEQSNYTFFSADERRIRSQASNFDAIKKAYNNNTTDRLDYNAIKADKATKYRDIRSLAFG